MSMHKIPLSKLERDGLTKHGLDIGTPSQLSDCFRLGVRFAKDNAIGSWVSVNDALPEECGTYFCLGHNYTPFVCLFRIPRGEPVWIRHTGSKRVDGITHWMFIPEVDD